MEGGGGSSMLYQLLSELVLFLFHNVKVGMLLYLFRRKSEIFQEFIVNAVSLRSLWQKRLLSF